MLPIKLRDWYPPRAVYLVPLQVFLVGVAVGVVVKRTGPGWVLEPLNLVTGLGVAVTWLGALVLRLSNGGSVAEWPRDSDLRQGQKPLR